MSDASEAGRGFWIAAVLGGAVMAYGVVGLLDAAPATRPVQVGLGLVGLDVLHDAIAAPIVCAVGLLLARFLPSTVRGPVRAGLFASAVCLVVAWPALRGYGRARVPDNPTVQPLDYGSAVTTVLVAVWVAVALWVLVRWWRARVTVTRG